LVFITIRRPITNSAAPPLELKSYGRMPHPCEHRKGRAQRERDLRPDLHRKELFTPLPHRQAKRDALTPCQREHIGWHASSELMV